MKGKVIFRTSAARKTIEQAIEDFIFYTWSDGRGHKIEHVKDDGTVYFHLENGTNTYFIRIDTGAGVPEYRFYRLYGPKQK